MKQSAEESQEKMTEKLDMLTQRLGDLETGQSRTSTQTASSSQQGAPPTNSGFADVQFDKGYIKQMNDDLSAATDVFTSADNLLSQNPSADTVKTFADEADKDLRKLQAEKESWMDSRRILSEARAAGQQSACSTSYILQGLQKDTPMLKNRLAIFLAMRRQERDEFDKHGWNDPGYSGFLSDEIGRAEGINTGRQDADDGPPATPTNLGAEQNRHNRGSGSAFGGDRPPTRDESRAYGHYGGNQDNGRPLQSPSGSNAESALKDIKMKPFNGKVKDVDEPFGTWERKLMHQLTKRGYPSRIWRNELLEHLDGQALQAAERFIKINGNRPENPKYEDVVKFLVKSFDRPLDQNEATRQLGSLT
jgi:hypothetical protein